MSKKEIPSHNFFWRRELWSRTGVYLTSPSHGKDHVGRVNAIAHGLRRKYGGDPEVISAAVILHDTGRHDPTLADEASVEESLRISKELLNETGFPEEKIDSVLATIKEHDDFSGPEPTTIESQILFDADKLDGLGRRGEKRIHSWWKETGRSTEEAEDAIKYKMPKRARLLILPESKRLAERAMDSMKTIKAMSVPRKEGERITFEPVLGNLEIRNLYGLDALERKLREKTLSYDPLIQPYQLSDFSLEEVRIDEIRPCSKYLLRTQLVTIRLLADRFTQHGLDLFNLDREACLIKYSVEGKPRLIYPPLVEESVDDGDMRVIVDGQHRIEVARLEGRSTVNVLLARNVAVPIPAYPVEYHEVHVVEEVPNHTNKRNYRFKTGKQVYRWRLNNWERFSQALPDENGSGNYADFRNLDLT